MKPKETYRQANSEQNKNMDGPIGDKMTRSRALRGRLFSNLDAKININEIKTSVPLDIASARVAMREESRNVYSNRKPMSQTVALKLITLRTKGSTTIGGDSKTARTSKTKEQSNVEVIST